MVRRGFGLYFMSLLAMGHRIRHDFAKETVIGFCSVVLLLLFYYIFNDFLNEEVQALSPAMRQAFGETLGWVLTGLASLIAGRMIRREFFSPGNISEAFRCLGEEPGTIGIYLSMKIPTLLAMILGPATWVRQKVFISWSLESELLSLALASLVALLLGCWQFKRKGGREENIREPGSMLLTAPDTDPFRALVIWKLKGMIFRNPFSRICLLLSFISTGLLLAAPGPDHPVSFLLALLTGILTACALAFQIASDLESSWIEKNLGVSHDLWMKSCVMVSMFVAIHTGAGAGTASLVAFGLSGAGSWAGVLKTAMIAFTPPFMVPGLALQIDARRAFVQILSLTLCSLFVGTAIYASLFSLGLLPLIIYYGLSTQKGRFYRA